MKANSVSIRIIAVLIALALCALSRANSGNADSQDKPAEKQSGLLGAFSGQDDPTDDRGPKADPPPTAESKPLPPKPNAIYSMPDPKALDKRIKQLEELSYENIKYAPSLGEAKNRINWLRQRAIRLRFVNDKKAAATVKALDDHKKQMEHSWLGVAAAMKDGKERTTKDWVDLANEMFGEPGDYQPPIEAEPDETIDDMLDMPTLEELFAEIDPEPAENETDPLKPPPPDKPINTTPPKLEDLIEAIEGQQKPETMHPITWARLLDRFGQDLAEFRTAFAEAMKELAEERNAQYDKAIEALKAAQRTYLNLEKLENNSDDNTGDGLRQHLAYRIYLAELAQLRLEQQGLRQMAEERQGKDTERGLHIRTNPMAPENTLIDLARIMEVSGTAGPPARGTSGNLTGEGLPGLYPGDPNIVVDKDVQYDNLVRANIARHQKKLRDIHEKMANAETLVKRREQRVLRREAAKLREKDRLEGKEGHPINEAYNRRTLRKIQKELADARPQHIAQLKTTLEAKAQAVVKQLEIDYKRRDEMIKAEKYPKTD